MNQLCKVCGEPAAGFHFGAFTCEGCKSFFGRSYNNQNGISECKNNNECIINKKNRTACKACRLRKCISVGMSKSGSRYGRRSNWFKIHCLLQEQSAHQEQRQLNNNPPNSSPPLRSPSNNPPNFGLNLLGQPNFTTPPMLHIPRTRDELMMLGFEDYKHVKSPSVSSPESHNSDSSVEVSDARRMLPMIPGLLNPALLPNPSLLFSPGYSPFYPSLLPPDNSPNPMFLNHPLNLIDAFNKRTYLDIVLESQRLFAPEVEKKPIVSFKPTPIQETPIDLSLKSNSDRGSTPALSDRSISERTERGSEIDDESDCDLSKETNVKKFKSAPLDLTTKL